MKSGLQMATRIFFDRLPVVYPEPILETGNLFVDQPIADIQNTHFFCIFHSKATFSFFIK